MSQPELRGAAPLAGLNTPWYMPFSCGKIFGKKSAIRNKSGNMWNPSLGKIESALGLLVPKPPRQPMKKLFGFGFAVTE